VRGSLQIVTTPLTWTLKMPLRGILTGISGRPIVLMSDNMEQLLQFENSPYLDDREYAQAQILRKLNRANSRGQKIGVDLAQLECKQDQRGIVVFEAANAEPNFDLCAKPTPTLFQKVSEARQTLAKPKNKSYMVVLSRTI
jgi:hypothetical protein